jgi:hypothetical protein
MRGQGVISHQQTVIRAEAAPADMDWWICGFMDGWAVIFLGGYGLIWLKQACLGLIFPGGDAAVKPSQGQEVISHP